VERKKFSYLHIYIKTVKLVSGPATETLSLLKWHFKRGDGGWGEGGGTGRGRGRGRGGRGREERVGRGMGEAAL
jgi:hypothetical protein